jgi:hypothetical protein
MNRTPEASATQERTFFGEVVGVHAVGVTNLGGGYRHEIAAGNDATLYVTLPEALPLWTAMDFTLRPAPANGKRPPIESES